MTLSDLIAALQKIATKAPGNLPVMMNIHFDGLDQCEAVCDEAFIVKRYCKGEKVGTPVQVMLAYEGVMKNKPANNRA